MRDNTVLNLGTGGDTIRTLDRLAQGIKTEVVQIDVGGPDPLPESLVAAGNPLPVVNPYDRVELALSVQQAKLLMAQSLNGFLASELPEFLGAL